MLQNKTEINNAIENNKLSVKFLKGPKDNPKINGIVLVKGTI